MFKENSYEALCYAQRTPYLQWLREQEPVQMDGKGKRPKLLPFLTCEESLVRCLERSGESMAKQDEAEDGVAGAGAQPEGLEGSGHRDGIGGGSHLYILILLGTFIHGKVSFRNNGYIPNHYSAFAEEMQGVFVNFCEDFKFGFVASR